MKNTVRSKKKRFFWRSFKSFSLATLRRKIGKWVTWDNMGLLHKKDKLKMWAPGLVKKVSSRRQVTIWVPSMITCSGAKHVVKPGELFYYPPQIISCELRRPSNRAPFLFVASVSYLQIRIILSSKLYRPGLPDYRHLDLTRIFQVLLYLQGNITS